ncbi:MAG: DUF4296 domain-containing protein [Marinifilaceae bacterium]|nr:DUF4296 domain-containing protein [Marinifilaceae bacterium]
MRYSFLWIVFVVLFCVTCSRAALDRDSFTALLIDMHTTDGILAEVGERRDGGRTDYMYYNALFEKYGITRADFDSCLNYYTRRPEIFQAIYDAVVDTLSRRQTEKIRVLNRLTVNDTVNIFPGYTIVVSDTIREDSLGGGRPTRDSIFDKTIVRQTDTVFFDKRNPVILVRVDSLRPGMYKFSTTLKWDKRLTGKRNRIASYFLSAENDSLHVRDIWVSADTFKRDYNWSYYLADSAYNRLEIRFVDSEPDKKAPKNQDARREGRIWGTSLYNTYVTPKEAARYEKQYQPHETKKDRR